MKKNKLIVTSIIILAAFCWLIWTKFASTTQIALINFQPFQTTSIVKANDNNFVSYDILPIEELDKIDKYDFVLTFGMGLSISAEQRQTMQDAANKGTPILVYTATNPDNNICSLDSIQRADITAYLNNGNKKNYKNMARYIRHNIDGKSLFTISPDSVVESASDVYYHLDEEVYFKEINEYVSYLKQNNFYQENAPKIAIVGGINDPFSGNRENLDSMIHSFQDAGMNVYPVCSARNRLAFLKEIQPDAVVYFAHGRMAMGQGDSTVEWLNRRNIPIFSPLTILQTKEEWMNDPMGMLGGFMSQSIVMPELDGAIYPYVVNAQEVDEDGLYLFKAIPERLKSFTQIIVNVIDLQRKKNADKKLAIYYFKGPGQEALAAQGLETVPSLYNLLKRLKSEGYKVENLPNTEKEFQHLLMSQGAVMNTYAKGNFDNYLKVGKPDLIEATEYESWISQSLSPELYKDVISLYGEAPGQYMSVHENDKDYLAVARIQLGNIALLPQPMAALGNDEFAIVHGAKSAPPHTYIAAYLWSEYAFKADAMLHFGTHGSLEFTPQKQVALSSNDWPDRLVGTIPHFYYYTIGNVGESMMAKRRSYATTISYLTPPFMESKTRHQFRDLQNKIQNYYKTDAKAQPKASLAVKKIAVTMGLHRELRLDSMLSQPYSTEDIERIENFAEEISNEKMTGQMYITGTPYDEDKICSTVLAISADPIAYSLAHLDKQRGKLSDKQFKNKPYFTQHYLNPAKRLVSQILKGKLVDNSLICKIANTSVEELVQSKKILTPPRRGMMAMMAAASKDKTNPTSKKGRRHPSWIPKTGKRPNHTDADKSKEMPPKSMIQGKPKLPSYSKEEKDRARAILEVERTIKNINEYKAALLNSPKLEMESLLNALAGGYISPSSGGNAVANPNAIPTGRNLYAINAEATPTEVAWDKGVTLVDATLADYKKKHGVYPQKVSYTFWSSEFIESEGVTIAQVLYMLGVEPVRDAFGRVSDIQLIPSDILGRPRIDIVVQTSGQFRDLAASRLALITRAVRMAAEASSGELENYVSSSATEIERQLVEQGIPPRDAREMSIQRVFGGINGMYGTGIQEMVKSGDKWQDEKEVADTYINNMSAIYGNDKDWGDYKAGLLRAVLHNTDVVVQPRQSNTWGALSLDHVFEFMGGLNLAVRNVTGKDPDAYFADYRNRNNMKIQDLKEAIGVESRSTVFNPAYIKEVMKGQASSAAQITEVVTNTYAWNVMKPDVIDNEMWDQFYEIYVNDSHNLGIQKFFKLENPAAMQEITAVMLETARKGMWNATDKQLADIAELHTELVKEFGASGSGFSGSNLKLQEFIAQKTNTENVAAYKKELQKMTSSSDSKTIDKEGMVLRKDTSNLSEQSEKSSLNGIYIVGAVLIIFIGLLVILKKKRKK